MPVDVNNTLNSSEDRVQYALGSMDAYSILISSSDGAANYAGIIALNHTKALMKVMMICSDETQDFTLKVNLCE